MNFLPKFRFISKESEIEFWHFSSTLISFLYFPPHQELIFTIFNKTECLLILLVFLIAKKKVSCKVRVVVSIDQSKMNKNRSYFDISPEM